MSTLYDKVLHGKFLWEGGKTIFLSGLKFRTFFFNIRDFKGRLLHPGRKSVRAPSDLRRILLIRTDRIGDIILSTPALSALRGRYPQCEIDYVVQAKYAPLLNCFDGWNNVFKVEIDRPRQLKNLGRELADRRYDVVVVQHPARYAYLLAIAAKAPVTIGWKAKGFGYCLSHGFEDDRGQANRHQVENNLKLLAPLAVPQTVPAFPVQETPHGISQCTAFFGRHGISDGAKVMAIHPGSYSPRVRWLPERFGELINRAHGIGMTVVLLGGAGDREVLDKVLRVAEITPVVAVDEMDFEGLVSFFRHTVVFVGNSTGPTHLAAAAGTWTIAIFGNRYPMDRWELWKPWGPKGMVVSSKERQCSDCLPWTCREMECMSSISVDDVWSKVLDALK